jgi:hypothetical protein
MHPPGVPVHMPAVQASLIVHGFPSLQESPSATATFEQIPVDESQVAVWHWSLPPHETGFDPTQLPDWQVSVWVQALPSLQAVPFGAAGLEQRPVVGSQVPATWQWSIALQVTGFSPTQVPARHEEAVRQRFGPGGHAAPSGAGGLLHTPVVGWHCPGR